MAQLDWKLGKEGVYEKTGRGLTRWVTILVGLLKDQFLQRNFIIYGKKKKTKKPKKKPLVEVKGLFEQMIDLYLTTLLFYSFSGLITFPFNKSF